ncbi:MAG: porin [Undibacterium sp.]|uniref:porin n=1 Tax=Undibacterium sp. TaxID=1914977 RepID=UPI002715C999|nr:porin [Undibacterium sp.]MDO8651468.1 porin [Undibacterium sp.]
MKKSLIAFAILGAFAATASAQSSVTIYGVIDAATIYTTNQNAAGGAKAFMNAGELATSRWGFKGTEDLGGGLKANFNLEGTLANDTGAAGAGFGASSTSLFDRVSTVGLSGNFGSVNFGRQNMLGIDSVGLADPLGLAHAPSNPNVFYSALNAPAPWFGVWGTNGGGTALRQNNSIKYLTPMVSGFGGAAMYGFGEQAGNTSASSYAGLSAYYADGASGAAFAYAKLKDATDSSTLTLMGGGAKYKMNALTFKATYVQNEVDGGVSNNRKIAVIGLGVDYALTAATTLTGAYYNTKLSGSATGWGNGKADQYIGMAKYAFSKRTIAYASLTYAKAGSTAAADTLMSSNIIPTGVGQSKATRTAVGVMHSF